MLKFILTMFSLSWKEKRNDIKIKKVKILNKQGSLFLFSENNFQFQILKIQKIRLFYFLVFQSLTIQTILLFVPPRKVDDHPTHTKLNKRKRNHSQTRVDEKKKTTHNIKRTFELRSLKKKYFYSLYFFLLNLILVFIFSNE